MPSRPRFRLRKLIADAWLRAFGWKIEDRVPDVEKAVIVAAPHTSNWDLPFGLAVAWHLGLRLQWVGKHTLFKPPFGWFMRALGGIPVDRRASRGTVEALVTAMNEREKLMLAVAAAGTRRHAARWKTGFYWAAVGAKVPIVLGYLDYATKRGGLGKAFVPTGDLHRDFQAIREFYAPMRGKHPERQGEISLGPEVEKPRE
jgi:1-acyl-sn-glycerol-3-phosphate acyltransferase